MFHEINTELLLWINSHHNSFLDFVMYWASDRFIWIPLYAFLLALFAKVYQKKIWIVLICVTLLILFCDQTANLAKDYFKELRPCNEPALANIIHIVNGYCGGAYGYISSHAANSTGLSIFTLMLLNKNFQWLKFVMFTYVALLCYSRIYLGAHYPFDVARGILIGIIFGFFVARFFKVAESKF
ncbi:MAG: phosphatase PAP2 family protein [Bacteroidia bacterium]